MKQKIGTLIDQEVMRLAKRRAAELGRPLSNLIQEALEIYLSESSQNLQEREKAYQEFCQRSLKLKPNQFASLLQEDPWAHE